MRLRRRLTAYEPGVVLDMAHKADGESVAVADIEAELGFTVYVFPLKIVGASAAPACVIAITE